MFSDLRLLPLLICPPMWFGSSFRKNGVLWPWQFALSSFPVFPGRAEDGNSSWDSLPGGLAKVVFFFFFFPPFFFFLSGQISEVQ